MLHPETTDHRPTSPQHHSTSQERPDTAPQHDRKGKGRARDDPIVSTGESSPAPTPDLRDTPPVQIMQPPTQSSASDLAQFAETTLKPSDRPRPVPRIRNRGLLESVHAHLAGRANQRDRDPNAPQISRARSTTQKSTPSAQSSSASAHEHKASSSRNSGTDSGHPGRPSLFERLSDSPSLPPSSSQSTGPSTPGGASHSSDDSAVARIVDARTRLLSKLLEEKCRHEVPTAADVSGARYADGLEQSASSTASCVGERPLPAEQEATDREAKLRSQALLRVRLAAAKKAASSQVAEPAPSSAEFSDVSSKEQMLKARLMQRRA
ncbi:hypothetical protein CERSUDRAFT_96235 [Gelatoporia subvermispora B]|uniref:Uncharacterized protein n=1 Tax=Ceriporiopsis subvermispora (strain B) TaxID=914234 RepID=M2RB56_CERS8|nr:hypothetical protein CERSUDRAFT_96235 [Gelatoporia subvermispora B]